MKSKITINSRVAIATTLNGDADETATSGDKNAGRLSALACGSERQRLCPARIVTSNTHWLSTYNQKWKRRTMAELTPTGGTEIETVAGRDGLTALNDGNFVNVYRRFPDDTNDSLIFAQHYAPDGTPIGDATQVSEAGVLPIRPVITTLEDGGYVVSWNTLVVQFAGHWAVFMRVFNADGTPRSDEIEVTEAFRFISPTYRHLTASAALPDGRFVLVWEATDAVISQNSDIYAQLYNPDGTPDSEIIPVNGYESGEQGSPEVVALPEGGFAVLLQDYPDGASVRTDDGNSAIRGQVFDTAGQPLGDRQVLSQGQPDNEGFQHNARVAVMEDGRLFVTWYTADRNAFNTPDVGADVYGQFFDSSLTPLSDRFLLNTTDNPFDGNPQVALLSDGTFMVVWEVAQSFVEQDIFGQRFSATGEPIGSEFRVNTTMEGGQHVPMIAALQGDRFVVSWFSDEQTGSVLRVFEYEAFPMAADDIAAISEDGPAATIDALANDVDANGDTLTIESFDTTGTMGMVALNGNGIFTYHPDAQFEFLLPGETAVDTFAYTVADGSGLTDTATVTVTIQGENEMPVAADDTFATNEDTAIFGNVLLDNGNGADTDADDPNLTVTRVDGAERIGMAIALDSGAHLLVNADGSFEYDPAGIFDDLSPGDAVAEMFTYTIEDGKGGEAMATVSIAVDGRVDMISGTPGEDNLSGTDGDDAIFALERDDIIAPGLGSHTIDGGDGNDTVVYDGVRAEFETVWLPDGSVMVTRGGAAAASVVDINSAGQAASAAPKIGGGTDVLLNVERVEFDNGALLFDINSPNVGFVYRMYQASLDRRPEEDGVRFHTDRLDFLDSVPDTTEQSKSLFLAAQFLESDEFEGLYGADPSPAEYIDGMYGHVLNRMPDDEGRQFWITGMERGLSREEILIAFSESHENVALTAPDIDNGIWVT